jgi:acyl-CoA synthetase (AMP-forming)/AMP-acid ligase II
MIYMSVPETPMIDNLRKAIRQHAAAGRIAFDDAGKSVSYAEFGQRIDAFTAGCQAWGVGQGTVVGLLARKSADAIAAFFGIMQAGGCACFIEPELAPEVIAARMRMVGMRHLIHAEPIDMTSDAHAKLCALHDLAQDDGGFELVASTHADSAMMLFTSGSTGTPKGLLLSHGNLACNAYGVLRHTGTSPDDKLLHVMPLYHTNGVNNQLIVPLLAGASIVLVDRFRAEDTLNRLLTGGITYMTGVPTMYSRMLPYMTEAMNFSHLRFLRCGSAPITPALHMRIEEKFSVPLIVSYGLSEASCTSTMNPPGQRRIGSIGTVLEGQTIQLFQPGTNVSVAAGGAGEICIGGPALMKGYIGSDTPSPISDGWLRTGDLGQFDYDGYLTITGRIKDVIIRGGENISPALIEQHLSLHPMVQDCCIIGLAHADLGEVPVAYVVARDGARPDTEELGAFVLEKLGRIYVPASFHLIQALPTNAVGKVDRKALRNYEAFS